MMLMQCDSNQSFEPDVVLLQSNQDQRISDESKQQLLFGFLIQRQKGLVLIREGETTLEDKGVSLNFLSRSNSQIILSTRPRLRPHPRFKIWSTFVD
jgi:hypothetical protein